MNMIVAKSLNGGIGVAKSLPWKLTKDLKLFKKLTSNLTNDLINHRNKRSIGYCRDDMNAIIMGRTTWDGLPYKPLPNRVNIVLSKNMNNNLKNYDSNYKNIILENDIDNIDYQLQKINPKQTWIIGGKKIYNEFLKRNKIENIVMTNILTAFPADTYLDSIEQINKKYGNEFELVWQSDVIEDSGLKFNVEIYNNVIDKYTENDEGVKEKNCFLISGLIEDILAT